MEKRNAKGTILLRYPHSLSDIFLSRILKFVILRGFCILKISKFFYHHVFGARQVF